MDFLILGLIHTRRAHHHHLSIAMYTIYRGYVWMCDIKIRERKIPSRKKLFAICGCLGTYIVCAYNVSFFSPHIFKLAPILAYSQYNPCVYLRKSCAMGYSLACMRSYKHLRTQCVASIYIWTHARESVKQIIK